MDEVTQTGGGVHTYYYYYARKRPPLKPENGDAVEGLAGGVIRGSNMPPPPPVRGAVHSAEIEYALGNLDVNPMYSWAPEDYEVSRTMESYFAHFIMSGDPNLSGLPQWPAYASGKRMWLDVVSRAETDTAAARGSLLDPLHVH
jgi:para-nitrobenzyl esterase